VRFVSYDTAALIAAVGFCTVWIVLVLQDIGRKAAGQRAMLYEQLWEIAQQQERHETLLSLIEASTSASRSDDFLD
jgi:hypothetical protein